MDKTFSKILSYIKYKKLKFGLPQHYVTKTMNYRFLCLVSLFNAISTFLGYLMPKLYL